jgi:hypothetical protein
MAVPVEQGSGMRNALAYGMPNKRGLIMALYVVCRLQINFNIIVRVAKAHKLVLPFSMNSLQCTAGPRRSSKSGPRQAATTYLFGIFREILGKIP